MTPKNIKTTQYITDIKQIITTARTKAYNAVNTAMVEEYWLICQRIVDEEQQNKHQVEHGRLGQKYLRNNK